MASGIEAEHAASQRYVFRKHQDICFVSYFALADHRDACVHLKRTLRTTRQAQLRVREVAAWQTSGTATQFEHRRRASGALMERDLVALPSGGSQHKGKEKRFVQVVSGRRIGTAELQCGRKRRRKLRFEPIKQVPRSVVVRGNTLARHFSPVDQE